ncbi:uncharacterized protein BCR38DRAFT_427043 [Pseudomassariella vexata]|uniref:Arb2 domain-containing protein n=1 Tax=Pseudomassariella vexata TaxID=1141098 RepID=A0A1Y2E7A9_9PEZI|nr:uncharacterized protein BCR38DRAFT_427043 [Pseudomassariella vexata]ORY67432.1 hypothetical protein BCR38DRAFT_427043 [Pseudomassariella vexata]
MNEACEKLVHSRLDSAGLNKVLLPLGTKPSQPHIPIFVSKDIKTKSRVVLIFGESFQDLGILAHRVLSGPGGVNKGSLVSIVEELQKQNSSSTDASPPGIIIANMGQTIWSPELKRPLTKMGATGAIMPSAVHGGMYIDEEKNRIPENRNEKEHVKYIFEKVVPAMVNDEAGVDILGLGDGADAVEEYLDWSVTWNRLQGKINCFAIVGGYHPVNELQCEGLKTFLREKACAWSTSLDPLGTPISGPDGNPDTTAFTGHGCPVLSGGEENFVERLLIHSHPHVLGWLQTVALTEQEGGYKNPQAMFDITYADQDTSGGDPDWSKWENLPLDQQCPDFGTPDPRLDLSANDRGSDGEDSDAD